VITPAVRLSREQLERLVEAHRAEFMQTYRDHLSDDAKETEECLADFEAAHLNEAAS
jgi:hypothetical protein